MPEEITTTEIQEKEPIETAAPVEETVATEESGENGEQKSEESASSEGEHKEEGQKTEKKAAFNAASTKKSRSAPMPNAKRISGGKKRCESTAKRRPKQPSKRKRQRTTSPTPSRSSPTSSDWDAFNAANREWMRRKPSASRTQTLCRRETPPGRGAEADQGSRNATSTEGIDAREERASKKHKDWEEIAGTE
jgi:hypothetical protein